MKEEALQYILYGTTLETNDWFWSAGVPVMVVEGGAFVSAG